MSQHPAASSPDAQAASEVEAAPRHGTAPCQSFDLYLLADRRRFQRLSGDGRTAVLITDEDHTLRYVNPAARALLDTPPSAPQAQRHLLSFVHRADLRETLRALQRLRREPAGTTSFLVRLFVHRGRWRWYKATAARFAYRRRPDSPCVTALFFAPLSSL